MSNTYTKEKMPLFEEHARNSHPDTSKRRAADLTETQRLARRMDFTLSFVFNYPGKTAAELKEVIFLAGEPIDKMDWPQKCMKRLVDEKLVWREDDGNNGQKCRITRKGMRKLGVI